MPQRKLQKSRLDFGKLANIGLWIAIILAFPAVAYAWDFTPPPDPLNACPSIDGFTKRIVYCIRNTLLAAVNEILVDLFAYFYGIVGFMATLAVSFWGIQMATGRISFASRNGFILAMKIGVIILLFTGVSFNFVLLFGWMLDAIGELLGVVTNYVNFSPAFHATCGPTPLDPIYEQDPSLIIWDRVDCALQILIGGVLNPGTVAAGLGGFLLASLITDAVGVFVALFGFFMIVQLLFAFMRAVYIFIMSYMAFALMALVAPIFIPLIMFRVTKGYFEKWLKLTIGFIMQPVFLFVYLAMLLAAYDTVVYTGPNSLYNTITFYDYWPGEGSYYPIGYRLDANGVYSQYKRGNMAVNYNVEHATRAPETCPAPPDPCPSQINPEQRGVTDMVGEVETNEADWAQIGVGGITNIYESLGIDDFFFFVGVPVEGVDWDIMGWEAGFVDTVTFLLNLFLSLIVALVTTYIFMLLLDTLPFIGSGIGGITGTMNPMSGMTGFGFGGLAPPGESMLGMLRKKVFNA